jgi:hypothetical protein
MCLAACTAASPHAEPDSDVHEHRMVGDENLVTVENAGTADHAAPWAEEWCAHYGKTARFRATQKHHVGRYAEAIDVQFECLARR